MKNIYKNIAFILLGIIVGVYLGSRIVVYYKVDNYYVSDCADIENMCNHILEINNEIDRILNEKDVANKYQCIVVPSGGCNYKVFYLSKYPLYNGFPKQLIEEIKDIIK